MLNKADAVRGGAKGEVRGGARSGCEYSTVFIVGGVVYGAAETLWRGYTHWTMLITGGACLSLLYLLNKRFPRMRRIYKAIGGAMIITAVEFIVGCIVNLRLDWGVWDYSAVPLNLLGQICLPYTLIWLILCIPAYGLCGMIGKIFKASQSAVSPLSSPASSDASSST